jgi:hypothetical protein
VPKFCRHGALADRCPICRAAIEADLRAAGAGGARPRRSATDTRPRRNVSSRGGLIVRHEARETDDGYRTPLAPGLRSQADARRLAAEIGVAAARLDALSADPPGLYAEIAREPDIDEAAWLAFLVAYLGPLETDDPFASIAAVRTRWGVIPDLDGAEIGPRGSHEPARGAATIDAYVRFAERSGGQQAALTGDPGWTAAQRFERVYERLALPGLRRRSRYELLMTLGRLHRFALEAPGLLLTEDDAVTLAAKRVFGIGDRLTLERRSRELAAAVAAPVEALDLALENWARAERITQGVDAAAGAGPAQERALAALRC